MRHKAIIIAALLLAASCTSKPQYPTAPTSADEIRIDISSLAEYSPRFYSIEHGGKRYDFFIQSAGGAIESYIDACIKCSPQRLGFRVEDKSLICKACNEGYPLGNLNGIGSCYPIPLPGMRTGNEYVIKLSDLIRKTKDPL